jgi:hypothetical protein
LVVGVKPIIPSGFELVLGSSVVVVVGSGVGVVTTTGVLVLVFTAGVFVFVFFPPPKTLDVSVFTTPVALLTTGTSGVFVFVLDGDGDTGEGAGASKDASELAFTGVSGEGPELGSGFFDGSGVGAGAELLSPFPTLIPPPTSLLLCATATDA